MTSSTYPEGHVISKSIVLFSIPPNLMRSIRLFPAAISARFSAVRAMATSSTVLELPRPDDFHLHLRDGDGLRSLMKGLCE
jgi:hypothetical protein